MRSAALLLIAVLAAAWPAAAGDTVEETFQRLLDNPQVLKLDVVPGPGEGQYARINVYAKRGALAGLLVEDLWMLITDVVADRQALANGRVKIAEYGEAAVHAFVLPEGLERAFREGTVKDAVITLDGETIAASGTYPVLGIRSTLHVRGRLMATGKPEVFFKIERLVIGALPMPGFLVAKIEHDINPVVNMRRWPVQFPVHSVKTARGGILISSLKDAAGPCGWCLPK